MGWFTTFTGKKVDPLEPKAKDVDIEDIAHALSHLCRFGGHSKEFYSVAQHSMYVADAISTSPRLSLDDHVTQSRLRFPALLHDASEAYVGDMIRPIKTSDVFYNDLESHWVKAIDKAFDMNGELVKPDPRIKEADVRMLITECRDLIDGDTAEVLEKMRELSPYDFRIWPTHDFPVLNLQFLNRFERYKQGF